MLWVKDRVQQAPCPNSLRFSYSLPTTYLDGDKAYVRVLIDFRVHKSNPSRVTLVFATEL